MKIQLVRCNERNKSDMPIRETNITGVYPPLGLAYIAAVLKGAGYGVEILDAHALNLSEIEFRDIISADKADIIGFTSTTLVWPKVVRAAKIVRETLPQSLIVVGGPQLTAYPKESLSFDFIDMGVYGEGEETMLELAGRYDQEKDFTNITGTVIKRNGKIILNPPRPLIENLDRLPFPAIELLPYERYCSLATVQPFFTMITSRGCSYHCAYCSQIYFGQRVRQRSAQNVVDEMELYVSEHKAKELIIFDDVFTLNKKRTLEICDLIEERNLRFKWNIRTRVDIIDEEILTKLKEAGCYCLHMGIESGSQRILDLMRKGITIEQIKKTLRLAKKLGLQTRGYFMLGYPGEDLKTIKKTLGLSRKLGLDWASYTITIPHPRTEIYELALRKGYLKSDYWRKHTLGKAKTNIPYFVTKEYNERGLKRLKARAYLSFYLRPPFLLQKIWALRAFYPARRTGYGPGRPWRILIEGVKTFWREIAQ